MIDIAGIKMEIIIVAYIILQQESSLNTECQKKAINMNMMALRKVIDINIDQKKYVITGTILKMIHGIKKHVWSKCNIQKFIKISFKTFKSFGSFASFEWK